MFENTCSILFTRRMRFCFCHNESFLSARSSSKTTVPRKNVKLSNMFIRTVWLLYILNTSLLCQYGELKLNFVKLLYPLFTYRQIYSGFVKVFSVHYLWNCQHALKFFSRPISFSHADYYLETSMPSPGESSGDNENSLFDFRIAIFL